MTGEMSEADVTREEFPLHFAIADALHGTVRPFDVYQGPYIRVRGRAALWIIADDGAVRVYDETTQQQSPPFFPDDTTLAVHYARELIRRKK